MPLLSHLIPGQLAPRTAGQEESGVRNVNPIHSVIPENPAQEVIDAAHSLGAHSVGNVGDRIAKWTTVRREVVPVEHGFERATEQVTAFIDHFVPIPWLHGDQGMTK